MKKGFTLVEVMVGIILASLVLGAGYQIWSAARRDFTTASTRQTIQHDVRMAIDTMASDFKSMKAGTLNVSSNGGVNTIKLDRYLRKTDASGNDENLLIPVTYEFREDSHILYRSEEGGNYAGKKILSMYITSLEIGRGDAKQTQVSGNNVNGVGADTEFARSARYDIVMTGEKKNTIKGKMETHTEKVSVYSRDEFYATISKGKHIKISDLAATEAANLTASKIDSKDSFFKKNLTEADLENMSRVELQDLLAQQNSQIKNAETRMDGLNKALDDINAKNKFLWIFPSSTQTSKVKDRIMNHSKKADLEKDAKELQGIIDTKETDFMARSFAVVDPKNKVQKEAYDLMLRKRSLEAGMKDLGDSEEDKKQKAEIQKNIDLVTNPAITRVPGESDEGYKARSEHAQAVIAESQKCNLTWMDSAKDEVKEYEAAKQIIDLANAKTGCADEKESAQANAEMVSKAIPKAKS